MALEKFHFKGNDGKDYILPAKLKAGVLRKARAADNDLDYVFRILEDVCSDAPETLAAIDDLDTVQLEEITKEWLQGLNPGNSSGSSN